MSKHEKSMNKYEKSILFIPQALKAFYVVILCVNLFLPLGSDGKIGFSLFQVAARMSLEMEQSYLSSALHYRFC